MKSNARTFFLFAALLAAVRLLTPFLGVVDDAWITYTYARNLAAGHGIAFNPGEHVEGCTAFLHMVLLAPFTWVIERIDIVAVLLNILAWAGVATLAWGLIRRRDGEKTGVLGMAAAALIALGLSGLGWTLSGMETPLVALCWLGGARLHLRERETGAWPWASALVTVAAGLLRPDGILLAIPLTLSIWIEKRGVRNWAKAIVYGVIVLGLFGVYWLWRWHYFGYPLPNTFYAKVTSISPALTLTGVKYTLRWIFGMIVPLLVIIAMIVARGRRPAPRWVRLMQGLVATSIGYVLLVGSDFFSYHRFFVPSYAPMILVGWWYGVGALNAKSRTKGFFAGTRREKIFKTAIVLVLLQIFYFISPSKPANARRQPAQNCVGAMIQLIYPPQGLVHVFIVKNTVVWRGVAQQLDARTPADTTIATIPIGAMGYFSRRTIIDMVGLTDEHIAHVDVPTGEAITGHEKYDVDYILQRAPELILTWPSPMPAGEDGILKFVTSNIGTQAQIKILSDRRTRIHYRFCRFPVDTQGDVIGLIRRDLTGDDAWREFAPLPDEHEEWLWYAFTAENIDDLFSRVIELRTGNFESREEKPVLNEGVSLPFSLNSP